MKILVTGGAGFIGGNFVHYMVETYPEDMNTCGMPSGNVGSISSINS